MQAGVSEVGPDLDIPQSSPTSHERTFEVPQHADGAFIHASYFPARFFSLNIQPSPFSIENCNGKISPKV